jgi:hypothetical protein
MLSDTERRATQTHSTAIEHYEAQRKREDERLWAPLRARDAELRELSTADAGPTDDPRVRRSRGLSHDESAELLGIGQKMATGLEAYDAAHKPSLRPWDTPTMILRRITELEFHWSDRLRELSEQAGIERDEQEWRRLHEDAASDAYQELYKRVLGFASLAPSVLNDLPETHNPRIGIEQIRAWCLHVMRQSECDDPIAVGLAERDEAERLLHPMIDSSLTVAEREEAGRVYQAAWSAWNSKWKKNPDARVSLFFELWETRLVFEMAGEVNRAAGTAGPRQAETDKLVGHLKFAEKLSVRNLPAMPGRPLNEMELDAAYQQLRQAIRDAVAPPRATKSVSAPNNSVASEDDGKESLTPFKKAAYELLKGTSVTWQTPDWDAMTEAQDGAIKRLIKGGFLQARFSIVVRPIDGSVGVVTTWNVAGEYTCPFRQPHLHIAPRVCKAVVGAPAAVSAATSAFHTSGRNCSSSLSFVWPILASTLVR